ncbi:MAG TPA: c-type cytochrome [Terriglobia bacterium]|nr:c-type cytochrome [Terriglobia bacterium]
MILRSFNRLLLLLFLLSACTAAGAWQESSYSGGKEKPRATEAVERGRSQFLKTCAFCHGPEANGGSSGPDLIRSSVVRHDEHGNLIGEVIRDGRPEKGMPAFQLTDAEITAVAAFLHYRVKQSDGTSPKEPGAAYSAAKLLIGNAAAGKTFFYGAGGCAACHSPTGDLAGIANKYPAAELQARFLYPPGQHLTATVTDRSGKQYTGEVRLLTNYDVAIVDRAGWYRSWPLNAIKLQIKDPLVAHRQLLSKFTDADMHNMLAFLETLK